MRLVLEHQGEHDSQWSAITSVASKLGCTAETLPASCITFPPIHAFTAQNTGFSDRNSVWLKFTASENKPHAIFLNLVQGRTESFVKRM